MSIVLYKHMLMTLNFSILNSSIAVLCKFSETPSMCHSTHSCIRVLPYAHLVEFSGKIISLVLLYTKIMLSLIQWFLYYEARILNYILLKCKNV